MREQERGIVMPKANLLEGIKSAFPAQMFPWDDYFLRMAETDWRCGQADAVAVKSFFIRRAPFGGAFALAGGITEAIRGLDELRFTGSEFKNGIEEMGYDKSFIAWLAKRGRLNIKVYGPYEGQIVFPNEPIITIVGPLADIRLAEGIITEAVNFPTLCLTKWHRLVHAVQPGNVLEFGRRRSQNAMRSSLYGILAGCFATSNAELRHHFDVKVTGTMGHEWVQSFGDVRIAFEQWIHHQPSRPIGLVDTKQCLTHDFPIWLDTVYRYREEICEAKPTQWGWRNDSGDLAYLSMEQYSRFLRHPLAIHDWFVKHLSIVLTNDLDEYAATSIINQIRSNGGVERENIVNRIMWAAGTKPSTCEDQPSLGGVAKLMEINNLACIKLAFDTDGKPGEKTSIPGFNFSAVIRDKNGDIVCLLIYPAKKYHGFKKPLILCHPENPGVRMELTDYHATEQQMLIYDSSAGFNVYNGGVRTTLTEVSNRINNRVKSLPWTMTRLEKPETIKVMLTSDLFELRKNMIAHGVLREDFLPVSVPK